jgi:uncharacterized protein (DUF488 family)
MPVVFTVGHSNKTADALVSLLSAASIDLLVDVRTSPYSRYNPQFGRENIARDLTAAGIEYSWRGKNLGGLGKNVNFAENLDDLVALATDGRRLAVMCSEGPWQKCHRYEMLTPEFLARGADVWHLQWDGTIHEMLADQTPTVVDEPATLFDIETPAPPRFGKFIAP